MICDDTRSNCRVNSCESKGNRYVLFLVAQTENNEIFRLAVTGRLDPATAVIAGSPLQALGKKKDLSNTYIYLFLSCF